MKLYISVDIEGVSGVVHGEHTARDGREHDRARLYMTEETNACIESAIEAGVDEIVVNDSHGTMRNILLERLHPEAELISGSPKKLAMVEGIDASFDAAIFLGYHTRNGTNGILNHTFNGRVVRNIIINGKEYGEFGLNAAVAGYYRVPVIMVSGCNLVAEEAGNLIPNIHSAIVKKTINRTVARNLSPLKAQNIIKRETISAIKKRLEIIPFMIDSTAQVELSFLHTGQADIAEILPYVTRVNQITVSFCSKNIIEAYQIIRSLIIMASTAK
ncbi:M55 family metallopeptidase [Cytobacillus sp. S13-E01]|uniref:M55 family metallopeptidase n=1 Tax=Cytobacillus sp. S13-E01 TaxID=3031326 RepID=UPI0023D86335|nr:M55 family metallopeptidase [Cytobacillus sp. S13-E01]MDF0726527.1 M55 family metallopeptidase [Cytobacillus sp. S13-E01]